jgi:hypothetical protein
MPKTRVITGANSRRYATAKFLREQLNAGLPKNCKTKYRAQRSDAGKKRK